MGKDQARKQRSNEVTRREPRRINTYSCGGIAQLFVQWAVERADYSASLMLVLLRRFASGPGWSNYKANLSKAEVKQLKEAERSYIRLKDGKPVEGFRYYRGLPDSLGK
jgi:hypothetical protein